MMHDPASPRPASAEVTFRSFEEFFDHYLREHGHPRMRLADELLAEVACGVRACGNYG
jgi:hypothetical protein